MERDDAADEAPADRLRAALDLCDDGDELMLQNLRRRFPGESETQIETRFKAWKETRPGAEHGDAGVMDLPAARR